MLDQLGLAHELGQGARAEADLLELLVGVRGRGVDHPGRIRLVSIQVVGDREHLAPGAPGSPRRQLAEGQAEHLFHADIVV